MFGVSEDCRLKRVISFFNWVGLRVLKKLFVRMCICQHNLIELSRMRITRFRCFLLENNVEKIEELGVFIAKSGYECIQLYIWFGFFHYFIVPILFYLKNGETILQQKSFSNSFYTKTTWITYFYVGSSIVSIYIADKFIGDLSSWYRYM